MQIKNYAESYYWSFLHSFWSELHWYIQKVIIFVFIGDPLCEINNTVKSRYLEIDGTNFYKFKLPEVQINLYFG